MQIGVGINPAIVAQKIGQPTEGQKQAQVAQGGANMFVGDKLAKKSARERAAKMISAKIVSLKLPKKVQKVSKKANA